MIQSVIRFCKRFAVLVPGIVIAYVSFYNIYPFIDRGTPSIVAFLITYIITAYGLIPAAINAFRLVWPPRHLPVYSTTPDGFASDPVNVGVIGTRRQLIDAMQHAGWHQADRHSLANMLREVISTIFKRQYLNSPMSSLFLFGRSQDLGFEIPISDSFKNRHHVRFWATTFDQFENGRALDANGIHWFTRREWRHHGEGHDDEELLWLGAASKDVGLAFIRHNAQLTHMIHPDTDAERDLIVDQLEIDGASVETTLQIMEPYKLRNRVWRGYLLTDGKLKVVRLAAARRKSSKS
jgi:hypothetical protein